MRAQKVYDAVIIGSGASGGMAAKQLTEHGLEVLVLEAGPPVDPTRDFNQHTWPYEAMYRGLRPSRLEATRAVDAGYCVGVQSEVLRQRHGASLHDRSRQAVHVGPCEDRRRKDAALGAAVVAALEPELQGQDA